MILDDLERTLRAMLHDTYHYAYVFEAYCVLGKAETVYHCKI